MCEKVKKMKQQGSEKHDLFHSDFFARIFAD